MKKRGHNFFKNTAGFMAILLVISSPSQQCYAGMSRRTVTAARGIKTLLPVVASTLMTIGATPTAAQGTLPLMTRAAVTAQSLHSVREDKGSTGRAYTTLANFWDKASRQPSADSFRVISIGAISPRDESILAPIRSKGKAISSNGVSRTLAQTPVSTQMSQSNSVFSSLYNQIAAALVLALGWGAYRWSKASSENKRLSAMSQDDLVAVIRNELRDPASSAFRLKAIEALSQKPVNGKTIEALAAVALHEHNATLRFRALQHLRGIKDPSIIGILAQIITDPALQRSTHDGLIERPQDELFLATLALAERGVTDLEPLLIDGLRQNHILMSLTEDDAEALATIFTASHYPVPIEIARTICDAFLIELLFTRPSGALLNFVGYTIEEELNAATADDSWEDNALTLDAFLLEYEDRLDRGELPSDLTKSTNAATIMVRDAALSTLLARSLKAIRSGRFDNELMHDSLSGYEIAEELWENGRNGD